MISTEEKITHFYFVDQMFRMEDGGSAYIAMSVGPPLR